ncbi:hypothetical protein BVY02_00380 [bacterium J17]|nr:hypothetical protein BVY02_00380 [bacterium J17]
MVGFCFLRYFLRHESMGIESKDAKTLVNSENSDRLFQLFETQFGSLILYSARSPVGDGLNEDSLTFHPCSSTGGVLAVADGVGGSRVGAEASKIAVSALVAEVDRAVAEKHSLRVGVINGFERANKEIRERGVGAATTIAVAEIGEKRVRSYHAGDCFVLVVGNKGKLKFQTIDHGPVAYGLASGHISEEDAMQHEERNIVSNVLGSDEMRIDIGPTLELAPRDTVVVASDGLSDNLSFDEISDIVRKGALADCAKELLELSYTRMAGADRKYSGKPDDLSFILYRPA